MKKQNGGLRCRVISSYSARRLELLPSFNARGALLWMLCAVGILLVFGKLVVRALVYCYDAALMIEFWLYRLVCQGLVLFCASYIIARLFAPFGYAVINGLSGLVIGFIVGGLLPLFSSVLPRIVTLAGLPIFSGVSATAGAVLFGAVPLAIGPAIKIAVKGTSPVIMGFDQKSAGLTLVALVTGLSLGSSAGASAGALFDSVILNVVSFGQISGAALGSIGGVFLALTLTSKVLHETRLVFAGFQPSVLGAFGAVCTTVLNINVDMEPPLGAVLVTVVVVSIGALLGAFLGCIDGNLASFVNLSARDVIYDLERNDDGWWTGRAFAQKIRFPSTFVEICESGKEIIESTGKLIPTSRKCLVIKQYTAKQPDEMSLEVGDEVGDVQLDTLRGDGWWWKGRSLFHSLKQGSFPVGHVVPYPSGDVSLMFVLRQFMVIKHAVVVHDSIDFHGLGLRSGDLVEIPSAAEAVLRRLGRHKWRADCRDLVLSSIGDVSFTDLDPWLPSKFAVAKRKFASKNDSKIDLHDRDIIRINDGTTSSSTWKGTNLTLFGKPTGNFPSKNVTRILKSSLLSTSLKPKSYRRALAKAVGESKWKTMAKAARERLGRLLGSDINRKVLLKVEKSDIVSRVNAEISHLSKEIVCLGEFGEEYRLSIPRGSIRRGQRVTVKMVIRMAYCRIGEDEVLQTLIEITPDQLEFRIPVHFQFDHQLTLSETKTREIVLYYSDVTPSKNYSAIATLTKTGQTEKQDESVITLDEKYVSITTRHFCGFGVLQKKGYIELIGQIYVPLIEQVKDAWDVLIRIGRESKLKETDITLGRMSLRTTLPIFVDVEMKRNLTIKASVSEGWSIRQEQKRHSIRFALMEVHSFLMKHELNFTRTAAVDTSKEPECVLHFIYGKLSRDCRVVRPWKEEKKHSAKEDANPRKRKLVGAKSSTAEKMSCSFPSDEEVLEIENSAAWQVVLTVSSLVGRRWSQLAIHLHISSNDIDEIGSDTGRSYEENSVRAIERWITAKTDAQPTVGDLLRACSRVQIARRAVVDEYLKIYGTSH